MPSSIDFTAVAINKLFHGKLPQIHTYTYIHNGTSTGWRWAFSSCESSKRSVYVSYHCGLLVCASICVCVCSCMHEYLCACVHVWNEINGWWHLLDQAVVQGIRCNFISLHHIFRESDSMHRDFFIVPFTVRQSRWKSIICKINSKCRNLRAMFYLRIHLKTTEKIFRNDVVLLICSF